MHDDDLHPHHELASAYLDGDLAEVERAQVQASPELTELVQSFRTLRSGLADVPPPAASVRDAAFAAAFAEFDALHGAQAGDEPSEPVTAPATGHVAPVVSLAARRRRMYTFVSAAAAVLLVGVVGMSVLKNSGSSDESASVTSAKDLAVESNAAGAPADAPGTRVASTIGSIGGDQAVIVALPIDDPAGLAALSLPDTDGDMEVASADSTVVEAGSDTTSASGTQGSTEPMALPTASYQRPAMACLGPNQVFLADIVYQGVFAIAARDTVTGVTSAIDDNCTVLATAP